MICTTWVSLIKKEVSGQSMGRKKNFMNCLRRLRMKGLTFYADVVLNHKAGGDRLEQFKAVEVDPDDRRTEIGQARDIKSWTGFDFPGRDGKLLSV